MQFRHQVALKLHMVNTSLISLWCQKDLERKRLILPWSLWNSRRSKKDPKLNDETTRKQRSKGCETHRQRESNENDEYYYDANILLWYFKMAQIRNRTPTSFLDFSRLEHAQATHEHTEQPTTLLGSVSFIDAIMLMFKHRCIIRIPGGCVSRKWFTSLCISIEIIITVIVSFCN